jgi:hypothetical protein
MRYLKTCQRYSRCLLLILLCGLLGACAELSTPTPVPVGPNSPTTATPPATAPATATAPARALATAAPAQPTGAAATTAAATTSAAALPTPVPVTAPADPSPSPVVAATATPAKSTATKVPPTATKAVPTPGQADSKSDEVGVSILAVNGNLPGRVASVTIQTAPGVECSINYLNPAKQANPAKGLSPQTSNQDGRITWTWLISANTPPGKGSVTVTCGDNSETRLITIGK